MTITLRPLTPDDLPLLWHWNYGVSDPEWKLYDGPYFERGAYVDLESFCQNHSANLPDPNRHIIEADEEPIGIVSRYEEAPVGGGWWELGIVIFDPAHWSRGYGSTALELWTHVTFAQTNAHVITLTTWSGNNAMIASATKTGFTECARIPQARLWQGQRYDSVKMARLADQ